MNWHPAHEALEDPSRWDHPAFGLWAWVQAGTCWTPTEDLRGVIRQVRRSHPGLGSFLAAVLEIEDESPILAALESGGCAAVYELAGCTWREARAHELTLYSVSYSDIAEVLGCGRKTAETHVRRAKQKLAGLLRDDLAEAV